MSLIDPQSRWWNRDSTRRILAYALWVLALVCASAGMLAAMAGGASPLPEWAWIGATLALPLMLGGTFLIAFGTAGEVDTRLIAWPLGGLFIALGVGGTIGGHLSNRGLELWHLQFVLFAVGGAATIVISELLRRRSRRNDTLQKQVERSGVIATGVVTRARGYYVNYQRVTKITVKFADGDGRPRWASQTIGGAAEVGQRMQVKYAPTHLGRRAAVIISRVANPR